MTTQERFNRVMHFQKPDRVPNLDFGYWDETIERWHDEGLPSDVKTNRDVEQYFGLEGTESMPELAVINGLYPQFEEHILEDKQNHQIVQNSEGVICEVSKSDTSIPRYIKFPIESRKDWDVFKRERLDYMREDRISNNLKQFVDEQHASGMPVRFNGGSLYGWLRNWMGLENISVAIMTEKEWVAEMMDHLTEMTLYLIEKSLPGLDVDFAWWWEDMCYNHGPLISPKLFAELLLPRYKEITAALSQYGIDTNLLDCDGRIYELVPGWLEAGINVMFPIEALHTSPFRLREEYGEKVLLVGGVNKIELAKDKKAIDRELEMLAPLVEQGGYIPTVDHRVPPDVSFENYCYYLGKKKNIL